MQLPNHYFSRAKAFIKSVITAKREPEPEAAKQEDVTIRDLKPEKPVKGGASNVGKDPKRSSGRTGEIDFMEDMK